MTNDEFISEFETYKLISKIRFFNALNAVNAIENKGNLTPLEELLIVNIRRDCRNLDSEFDSFFKTTMDINNNQEEVKDATGFVKYRSKSGFKELSDSFHRLTDIQNISDTRKIYLHIINQELLTCYKIDSEYKILYERYNTIHKDEIQKEEDNIFNYSLTDDITKIPDSELLDGEDDEESDEYEDSISIVCHNLKRRLSSINPCMEDLSSLKSILVDNEGDPEDIESVLFPGVISTRKSLLVRLEKFRDTCNVDELTSSIEKT